MSAAEPRDLETILFELSQVTEDLLATPDDEFARRMELGARRDRLQREAADAREGRTVPDDPAVLRRRIRFLEQRRAALRDQRLFGPMGLGSGGAGGGGYGDPEQIAALNRGILSAGGADEIDAELAELRRRLAAVQEDDEANGPPTSA